MDKGSFLKEVEHRLGTPFPSLAENCTRAVFKVLHQRIEPGQAEHVETHLPPDLKADWRRGYTGFTRMDKHEFLEAVKNEACFRNTDEAFLATRAVFGALKAALPEKDVEDTGDELPEDLREIWTEAA
ncbi:MAG: DUF2267 domain-containing protein [Chloroflexi bacterium]|nr:DUF2267 domain-containing protein [Chloroflexota bacterium]